MKKFLFQLIYLAFFVFIGKLIIQRQARNKGGERERERGVIKVHGLHVVRMPTEAPHTSYFRPRHNITIKCANVLKSKITLVFTV